MNTCKALRFSALGLVLVISGCKSANDRANEAALDQAKQQAASTGVAQQVVYTDRDGAVVTSIVHPPAPGQTVEEITTSRTTRSAGNIPAQAVIAPAPINPASVSSASGNPVNGNPAAPAAPYAAQANSYATNAPACAPNSAGCGPTVTAMAPASIAVPRGTTLAIRINQHISVKTSRAGDGFTGEVVRDVVPEGQGLVAIPRGTPVHGVIDASHRRGHFKGRSILELRLTSMELNGQKYDLDTSDNVRTKKGKGKRSAAFIGGGAGLGMLVGGVATGGVGLLVGGLAGAGAGTAIGGFTGNRDIEIPSESVMNFRLADDLAVAPQ
jgi:hypothetical protein